jgi:hypothetical protein
VARSLASGGGRPESRPRPTNSRTKAPSSSRNPEAREHGRRQHPAPGDGYGPAGSVSNGEDEDEVHDDDEDSTRRLIVCRKWASWLVWEEDSRLFWCVGGGREDALGGLGWGVGSSPTLCSAPRPTGRPRWVEWFLFNTWVTILGNRLCRGLFS